MVANGCEYEGAIETASVTLSEACNIGIGQARGEYIVRIDADDWIDEAMLKTELDYMLDNPDIDAVWCDYITAHQSNASDTHTTYDLDYLSNHNLEHACAVMFKKSVWEELGGYDEVLEYQESYDFWSRFKEADFKAERLFKPMYVYRRGHESMSTNPARDKVRAELRAKYE